ncbi:MAG: hypothetical protein Aurels2KO_51580 [Aureliella sp.]
MHGFRSKSLCANLLASVCAAAGFLSPSLFWLTSVGLAIWIWTQNVAHPTITSRFVFYLSTVLALVIAFYWSPQAMAYAMDASVPAGLGVTLVIVAFEALRITLPILLAARITANTSLRWLAAGLLAVAAETWMPSVFPWRLGYPLLAFPVLVQASDLLGPGFPTLLSFAIAGLMLHLLRQLLSRRAETIRINTQEGNRALLLPALFVVTALVYGSSSLLYWEFVLPAQAKLRVALCQAYPMNVESVDNARRISSQIDQDVDLVCWPESIGGTYSRELYSLSNESTVFANSLEPDRGLCPWPSAPAPLLVGGKTYDGLQESPDSVYVSALLIEPQTQQIVGRYDKRNLMPFGEYVPFKDTLPYMDAVFGQWDEITPGGTASPIELQEARLGVTLCYEDMVPTAVRSNAAKGANVLVSLADGSSFESPTTRRQHLLLSQLRAIENRKCLVRCASTGVTCVILPTGRILDRLPLEGDAMLVVDVPLIDGNSIYTACGDVLCWISAGCLMCWAMVGISFNWRPSREPAVTMENV